jgi:hypothetical protein
VAQAITLKLCSVNLSEFVGWLSLAVDCPSSQLGGFALAIAGMALTANIAAITAATASTKIMRLNKAPPPFPSAVVFIIIIFLLSLRCVLSL